MPTSRLARRSLVAAAAALGLTVALAAPALAHVDAKGTTEAGVTTVTFTFQHGCNGSPTTSLRVQLPAGTTQVTAQDPAGFTSQASATEISWTGGSVPDGTKGTFAASMTLTAAPGTTVFFPTIQGCAQGTNDWIEIPQPGQPEPEFVAPSITMGATATGDHDHDKPATTAAEHDHDKTDTPAEDHDKPTATSAPATSVPATSAPGTSAPGTTVTSATPASSSSNTGLLVGIAAAVVAALVVTGIVIGRGRRSTPDA